MSLVTAARMNETKNVRSPQVRRQLTVPHEQGFGSGSGSVLDPYSLGLLTLDPDPYSEYGSGSGSRCSILPDIFFKKSNFLTKIHIFKLKFFSYEKKTNFLSVTDG